jgi:glycylpeptide N-tetradecanoyltransferase
MFRFDYSRPFLKWAMTPPGYYKDWHIGVRKKESKELLAFISGIPAHIRIGEKTMKICEINFLCVSKKLRDKRLAPILIKEVTRRVNLQNIWQAIYTAGRDIPTPISSPRYYHRNLNPEKLVDIGFSRIPPAYERFDKPMEALKRALSIDTSKRLNLRPMKEEDLPVVADLLKKQIHEHSAVAADFDAAELKHWMITNPADQIVFAFVKEDPKTNIVTDFVSFYQIKSTVLKNEKYKELKAAYAYYYAASTVDVTKLFNEALILAKELGFDVFNALDIMSNKKFIEPLKFGPGDGYLRYYLFNWKLSTIQCAPENIGVVML